MSDALQMLLTGALVVLGVLALCCLIRCVLGPRVSDRIIAINMLSTLTIIMVGVLCVMLGEGYLADVGLVYAMISFLAVVLLCKVYTGLYRERRHQEQQKDGEEDR